MGEENEGRGEIERKINLKNVFIYFSSSVFWVENKKRCWVRNLQMLNLCTDEFSVGFFCLQDVWAE